MNKKLGLTKIGLFESHVRGEERENNG